MQVKYRIVQLDDELHEIQYKCEGEKDVWHTLCSNNYLSKEAAERVVELKMKYGLIGTVVKEYEGTYEDEKIL